jgi:SAM-dependent methyltransferase
MTNMLKLGEFTGLAENYSQNRPNYSNSVLNSLLGYINKDSKLIDFVDVGAGTGIWTRMVYDKNMKTSTAVEPNDDMREIGIKDSNNSNIKWCKGSGEATGLENNSYDFLTMASSFHWVNFDTALEEFRRILRPGGVFTALWNPRNIKDNPLLMEVENFLSKLDSNLIRVSSGKSGITEKLGDRLLENGKFEDLIYIEGNHSINMSVDRYIGAWRSVNDLRVQLGNDNFSKFLNFLQILLKNTSIIECKYLTRSWSVKKKD